LIIFIIKIVYSTHTLIYKREKFEVRNSPLNKYASIISQALYCIKYGCAGADAGATFIASGMAYDTLLEEAGRPRQFLPLMWQVYKGVFGEVPNNLGNNSTSQIGLSRTPNTKEVESVTQMVTIYQNMSSSERAEFMAEIKSSFEEESNK
jgi:hypothetical protein